MRTTYQRYSGVRRLLAALVIFLGLATAFYVGKHAGYSTCMQHTEASLMQGLDSALSVP